MKRWQFSLRSLLAFVVMIALLNGVYIPAIRDLSALIHAIWVMENTNWVFASYIALESVFKVAFCVILGLFAGWYVETVAHEKL